MEALLNLKSVLCDPEGCVCISGSNEDTHIIQSSLTAIEKTIERQAAQIEGLNEQVAELERAKEYKYVEQVLRPIKILIALAQSAETLAENSEETENSSGKIALGMPSDFETLSENLDLLDELPDDKPGYTLSGAAKAAWALRDLLGENYD